MSSNLNRGQDTRANVDLHTGMNTERHSQAFYLK